MSSRSFADRARTRCAAPLAVSALVFLSACAGPSYQSGRTVYDAPHTASRPAYAEMGTVREIDLVQIERRPSGAGAVLGAVLGGVLGNQFGSGGGRFAATGVGAVAGAMAGNAVETQRGRREDAHFRVRVRFDDGSVRSFDYWQIDDLRVGDRVRWENGQLYRG
jgi:outer membrane lipoprotein SlyB